MHPVQTGLPATGLDDPQALPEDQKNVAFLAAVLAAGGIGFSRRRGWGAGLKLPLWASALSATLLVQVVSSFAAAAVPLLGPILTQRWGLAPEDIGYVSAVVSAGICWFLACGGPMLDHHGPIRTPNLKKPEKVSKKAVDWLLEDQERDGSWYGRWGICYLYGTWSALTGMKAAGP